jgi:K+ transporter
VQLKGFGVMSPLVGCRQLQRAGERATPNPETFIGRLSSKAVFRVPGTAVFFTGRLEQTSQALQQLVRHAGGLA